MKSEPDLCLCQPMPWKYAKTWFGFVFCWQKSNRPMIRVIMPGLALEESYDYIIIFLLFEFIITFSHCHVSTILPQAFVYHTKANIIWWCPLPFFSLSLFSLSFISPWVSIMLLYNIQVVNWEKWWSVKNKWQGLPYTPLFLNYTMQQTLLQRVNKKF